MRVFHREADDVAFLKLIDDAATRLPLRVLSYCLIPNHFHLVLWPRADGDLSRWMQWLLTAHVRPSLRLAPLDEAHGRPPGHRILAPPARTAQKTAGKTGKGGIKVECPFLTPKNKLRLVFFVDLKGSIVMFRLRVWAMCCVAMIGITTMTGCTCDAFVLEEINGVITDDTGAAVGNAIVRIQSGLAFDDEEVVTREDGSFEHIGFLGLGPCVIGTLPKPFIGTIFVAVTKDGQQGSATIDVTQAQQTLRPNRRIIDLGQITIALQ